MNRFKTRKAYLAVMAILSVFVGSSLVYGGSDGPVTERMTPYAVKVAALPAGFGGAGLINQGIDTGTTTVPPLVTGYHVKGALRTETTSGIVTGIGTMPATHPSCQDSCRL